MSDLMPVQPSVDWLAQLLGPTSARVLRAYVVGCLHHAHAQAAYRYRLAPWTNNNTYGTDRFHCLCSTLGSTVEVRVPSATVHRPDDEFGSPFLIEFGASALYAYRYGDTAASPSDGLALRPGWLRERLVRREPLGQQVLDLPNLPPISLSRIVFLAWAGNRVTGLERAFFGRPYLDRRGRLCWLGPVEELDIQDGRRFALPGVTDESQPLRHSLDYPSLANVQEPPPFDLGLLDRDAELDLTQLFSAGLAPEDRTDDPRSAGLSSDDSGEGAADQDQDERD